MTGPWWALLDLDCLGFIKYIENRQSSLGVFCFSEKCVLLYFCNTPHSKGNAVLVSQGLIAGGQKTDNASLHLQCFGCLSAKARLSWPGGAHQAASQPEEAEHRAVQRLGEERVPLERDRLERETMFGDAFEQSFENGPVCFGLGLHTYNDKVVLFAQLETTASVSMQGACFWRRKKGWGTQEATAGQCGN